MWREESSFYIGQDIGDYIGDILQGFGLVQEAESREIQAATSSSFRPRSVPSCTCLSNRREVGRPCLTAP